MLKRHYVCNMKRNIKLARYHTDIIHECLLKETGRKRYLVPDVFALADAVRHDPRDRLPRDDLLQLIPRQDARHALGHLGANGGRWEGGEERAFEREVLRQATGRAETEEEISVWFLSFCGSQGGPTSP
jgi:hypothetical protein